MTALAGDTDLPEQFFAAWERSALIIDGVPATDAGRAIWVQAGVYFVDVRGPGGFASDTCFAGTAKWAAPHLTWTHLIDRAGSEEGADAHDGEAEDRGHITFDGDDLIETGAFIAGAAREYHERWTPLAGTRAPVLAATASDGICVRVGDHAAAVIDRRSSGGEFVAAYWRWTAPVWNLELAIDGDPAQLPRPLEGSTPLPAGWRWHTDVEVRT